MDLAAPIVFANASVAAAISHIPDTGTTAPDDEFVLTPTEPAQSGRNTYPLPILLNTSPTSPLFRERTNGSRVESCCHSYSVDSAICCAISSP
jgi:hypothetical protein